MGDEGPMPRNHVSCNPMPPGYRLSPNASRWQGRAWLSELPSVVTDEPGDTSLACTIIIFTLGSPASHRRVHKTRSARPEGAVISKSKLSLWPEPSAPMLPLKCMSTALLSVFCDSKKLVELNSPYWNVLPGPKHRVSRMANDERDWR